MLKSVVGASVGALTLATIGPLVGLLLGWTEFDKSLLVVGGIGAIGGAMIGWIRPGIFLETILFFIEPSAFD